MLDVIFRILALLLLFGRYVYWEVEKKTTEKKLPKTKRKQSFIEIGSLIFAWIIFLLVCSQLIGVRILPISGDTIGIQLVGLVVLLIGTGICISARRTLAENWVSGEEYQIKKNQHLITNGIYGFVRHPIYIGLGLSFIGGEMVAQSYLFVSFLAYFFVAYMQGKREEKILIAHFGKEYKEYMKKTKMLIPWVV